jgi:hypothetical protein
MKFIYDVTHVTEKAEKMLQTSVLTVFNYGNLIEIQQ